MDLIYLFGIFTFICAVSSRVVDVVPKPLGKQLFLSRHVITEAGEFDGGVLVNEKGIIEAVLRRDLVISLLAQNLNDLKIVDGGELALMAGVVDSHVHVNEPGRTSWEGYVSATQAAAVGGITTIIDMPLNSIPPTTTLENLKIKAAMAKEEVFVDVGFWGGVVPGNEIELHDLIRAGVVGFKCFLTDSGVSEFPNVSPSDLPQIFEILNGTGTVLAFHAEVSLNTTDKECTTDCPNPILYDTYLATHPEEMELKAVSLVTSYLPQTDVHIHIVHVSAEGVVPILEAAREKRLKAGYAGWNGGITAETCNHYLTLSSDQIPPGHSEYKCSPPIRNNTNKQKLWEYIKDRRLDLVTSDHSPSVEELKGTNFLKAWGGISSVQFDLSLFWTEAKARGYDLSTASHYLSAGPARLVGLQDRKGSIRPGLDADLILFDPNASFIVTPEVIRYKNKISPYMNRVLTGVVRRTYLRGQLVYADGELIGQPKGKLLLADEITETHEPEIGENGLKTQTNVTNDFGDEKRNRNQRTNDTNLSQAAVLNDTTGSPVFTDISKASQGNTNKSVVFTNTEDEKTAPNLDKTIQDGAERDHNATDNRILEQTSDAEGHNISLSSTESTNISETTTIKVDLNTNTTVSIAAGDANNASLATTETPSPIGTVKKWFNNVMNRGTQFMNNVTMVLGASLTAFLSKYLGK